MRNERLICAQVESLGVNGLAFARDSLAHIVDVLRTKDVQGAPPQRNLIVPIVYSKTVRMLGDEAFMRETFPVMMQFMRFWFADRDDGHPWRDGNDDRHGPYWQGNYWRGTIWPPTNYIVYLSVRQAGWTDVAAELAAKSRRLFMDDWLPRHHANENYPPEGGTDRSHFFTGNGGRDPHYVWAGLLPMLALEELFSVEDLVDGIRFGTTDPESFGKWNGFLYQGKRGRIRVDEEGMDLEIDNLMRVRTDAPARLRQFVVDEAGVRFRCDTVSPTTIRIETPHTGGEQTLSVPAERDQGLTLPQIGTVKNITNVHEG